jgi:GNAT superfamily N-acetyltransferase
MGVSDSAPRLPVRLARTQTPLSALAPIFGRAFVHEPMMRWPLGSNDDVAERFTRCFAYFLEAALPLGWVWEAGQAEGAAVWIPPGQSEGWEGHPWNQTRILALANDAGRRYDAFWDWVATHDPTEPSWQLDSIAVLPELQGRGIGKALIEAGLAKARAQGACAFLSTGTAANVAIYGRSGFRVYDEADAPNGGPHIWFMRWDPRTPPPGIDSATQAYLCDQPGLRQQQPVKDWGAAKLTVAQNAHDVEAMLECFHNDYRSEQPLFPSRN